MKQVLSLAVLLASSFQDAYSEFMTKLPSVAGEPWYSSQKTLLRLQSVQKGLQSESKMMQNQLESDLQQLEQKSDTHDGFAVLVASLQGSQTTEEFLEVRDHINANVRQQGDITADVYAHHWAQNLCLNGSVGTWHARDNFASCGDYADVSASVQKAALLELFAWGHSLLNVTRSMQRLQQRDNFTYDVVFVARDDYFITERIKLPAYNVSKVHAGFDGSGPVWVPSVLVLSSKAVGKLAAAVASDYWPRLRPEDSTSQWIEVVREWIERVTGMPVVMDTTPADLVTQV